VRDDRLRALARADAVADDLVPEPERRLGHPIRSRLLPGREKRVVRHTSRGQAQHRPEVERESGATGMILAGGRDEEDVGTPRET